MNHEKTQLSSENPQSARNQYRYSRLQVLGTVPEDTQAKPDSGAYT